MSSTLLRPIFGWLLPAVVALSSLASAQIAKAPTPTPKPASSFLFPPVLCSTPENTTGCTVGSVTTTTPTTVTFPSPTASYPAQCASAGYAPFDWCTAGITQACDGSADGCDPGLLQATTLDLPKFNPGTCQKLIRAKLRLDLDVINELCVENLNPGPTPIQYSQNIVACVQAPFTIATPPSVSISVPQGPFPPLPGTPLTGFDGIDDFSGTSGECVQNNLTTFSEYCFDDPTELANFIGAGTISFKHRGSARTNFFGPGNYDTRVRTCGRVRATITYTYCCCITTPNVTAVACSGGPAVDICLPITSCTGCTITCANVTLGTPTLGGSVVTSPSCQVACPAPGCCVRYTAPTNTGGVDTFTYTVNVPGCPPVTGTVTVNVCRLTAPNVTANTCSTNTVDICLPITASPQCGTITCSNVTLSAVTGGGTVAVAPSCGVSCPAPGCCVRYNPAGSTGNTVTFTYTVTSPTVPNCSKTGTVTVNICRLTSPNVTASVCSDGTVDICLPITATPACGTITCSNVSFSAVTGGGTVAVSTACTSCASPQCCVRYNATGSTGSTASFTYTVTAPGVPACTSTGTVTVNICRLTAPPVCIDVCSGNSGKACLPYTFTTACGTVTCTNVTLGTPPLGTLEFGNCTGVGTCTTNCCIQYSAPAGLPYTEFVVPYTVNDNAAGLTCSRQGDITIRIYPTPTANDDLVSLFLPPPPSIPINVLANDDPGSPCGFGALTVVTPQPLTFNGIVQGTVTVDNSTTPPRLRFTPAPTFNLIENDQLCFTYQICNACPVTCAASPIPPNTCCDQAQVCIRVRIPCAVENRNECGSLLLFPEYDNRAANRTLVTITDGCCLNSQVGTSIEVVFIEKDTCEETNRTFSLSPCDTLTFLTSAVNPGPSQGYLYAYAKNTTPAPNNPLGSPIVFNHLIGQEVVLDGITSFEYAINAISFKGYGNEGDLNDDDGDGIRDLNEMHGLGLPPTVNPEYSAVPDRILVPRFLGQSNPGETRLILIGLSGGRLFDTSVSFEGYNDNEVPFSASYTFRCWDKPLLTQISGAFLQTAMKTAGDDVDEIVGRNTHEAGWFWLDGDVALSTAETIHDPAVYAVLIERSGGQYAAELPFEFCGQANGDLLPTGLFGDGPNPVNGDDQ